MHDLHELKEKLMKELEEYGGNAKFSKEDVETIKYMASAIDHICNIAEEEEEYSGRYPYWMGGAYAAGNMGGNMGGSNRSYRGSYAGRRRRDSMGRYSGEYGYSRNDLADKMRELMDKAPDERTREDMRRMVEKLENA